MNSILKLISRPKSLVSVSHAALKIFGGTKCSQMNTSKFSGIVANSSCLVAGCCFSRQSDEDTLLSNSRENSILVDVDVLNHGTGDYHHSPSKTPSFSVNIKRTAECVDETVLPDNIIADSSKQSSEPLHKKLKTVETNIQEKKEQEKKKYKPPKQRPNYFVAVQISNPEIQESLRDVHNHILKQEPRLKKSLTKLKTLHITLMVIYIGDVETHERAVKALQNVHHEYDDHMSENPLHLQFQGLGHFQNRVLFAKLTTDDAYKRLCSLEQSVKQHFSDASLSTTDSKDKFTPHLTVAKIDFKDKRKGIKKIDPSLYEEFSNQYFGSQRVESIQLLSMTNPKNEAGYYSGDEMYFSAFNPSSRMNLLKKMLAVEEQKKEVKEMINRLVKDKLK